MFVSASPYADLIFQDAAQQLRVIEQENRYYDKYLGPDFMRARRIVDCYAKASITTLSLNLILIYFIFVCVRYQFFSNPTLL